MEFDYLNLLRAEENSRSMFRDFNRYFDRANDSRFWERTTKEIATMEAKKESFNKIVNHELFDEDILSVFSGREFCVPFFCGDNAANDRQKEI